MLNVLIVKMRKVDGATCNIGRSSTSWRVLAHDQITVLDICDRCFYAIWPWNIHLYYIFLLHICSTYRDVRGFHPNPGVIHGDNDEIFQCWRTNNFIALVWASITQSSGKDLSQGGSEDLTIGTTIVMSIALCYYIYIWLYDYIYVYNHVYLMYLIECDPGFRDTSYILIPSIWWKCLATIVYHIMIYSTYIYIYTQILNIVN